MEGQASCAKSSVLFAASAGKLSNHLEWYKVMSAQGYETFGVEAEMFVNPHVHTSRVMIMGL